MVEDCQLQKIGNETAVHIFPPTVRMKNPRDDMGQVRHMEKLAWSRRSLSSLHR